MKSLDTYLDDISRCFEKRSKLFLNVTGLMVIAFIGVIDYLTGYEIELAIFYLIPITLLTWLAGRTSGELASFVSTLIIFLTDMMAGKVFSHPLILFWNTLAILGIFLVIVFALSSLKTSLERERTLARTDSLTGVANSGYFKLLTQHEIERCRRYQSPFTFAYIDCDNFKILNDEFGHHEGDNLLILVANTVRQNIRKTDIVARLGGDEFGVLLPDTGDEQGRAFLGKIQATLLEVMKASGWPVTVSIGAVTYMKAPDSTDEVIKSADNLMYSVKKSGKNDLRHKVHR